MDEKQVMSALAKAAGVLGVLVIAGEIILLLAEFNQRRSDLYDVDVLFGVFSWRFSASGAVFVFLVLAVAMGARRLCNDRLSQAEVLALRLGQGWAALGAVASALTAGKYAWDYFARDVLESYDTNAVDFVLQLGNLALGVVAWFVLLTLLRTLRPSPALATPPSATG